jgi:hypothetical protein
MDAIRWVQDLPLSTWIRQSSWMMLALLILHLFGLGFLTGAGGLIAGRALGLARGVEPERFACFVPVMWVGFGLMLVSGGLLLAAYPIKATSPILYVKFGFLIGAALLTRVLLLRFAIPLEDRYALPPWSRVTGFAIFVMWFGAIACGELLKHAR